MIKRVGAMPPGTVGFQTVGDVYTDDWEEVVEPVLHEQIKGGAKIRMLLIVGPKNRAVDGVEVGSDLGLRSSRRHRRPGAVRSDAGPSRQEPDALKQTFYRSYYFKSRFLTENQP